MRFRVKTLMLYALVAICAATFGWYMYIATNKTRLFVTHPLKQQLISLSRTNTGLIPLTNSTKQVKLNQSQTVAGTSEFQRIDCSINQQYLIDCILQSGTQNVFIPFSFVRSYFDIYGQLKTNFDGRLYLQFQHSYSKVFIPQERYDYRSGYLWFDSYNVETRDRVIRLSGEYGVPLSNQWSTTGHLYPVQICQFGLSHFSKQLQDPKVFTLKVEDGTLRQKWWRRWMPKTMMEKDDSTFLNQFQNFIKSVPIITRDQFEEYVLLLNTSIQKEEDVAFQFRLRKKSPFYQSLLLSLQIKAIGPFRMRVFVQNENGQIFNVTYTTDIKMTKLKLENLTTNTREPNSVYYIGNCGEWTEYGRDLAVDVLKSLPINKRRNQLNGNKGRALRIFRIHFAGQAYLDNVTLNSNLHQVHFDNSANWLLQAQDRNGGWPVQVERSLLKGRLRLKAGWYSAMAQGQAMSLLVRKHLSSGNREDTKFLEAAVLAVKLFQKNSSIGGVRTLFDDRHVWYEEYPTQPSLFVLNGFIYSLFGLYDLSSVIRDQSLENIHLKSTKNWTGVLNEVNKLYEDGLKSLLQLLPLFDTGSGTLYDLRHFSLKVPPNLARWDYHTTHINQLMFLNTIVNRESILQITNRWMDYMQGKKSPHN